MDLNKHYEIQYEYTMQYNYSTHNRVKLAAAMLLVSRKVKLLVLTD